MPRTRDPLYRLLLIPVVLGTACSDSPPTGPATPTAVPVSIALTLTNPGTVSLSDAVACPGDWTTCPKGPQSQGPPTSSMVVSKTYQLMKGTYRTTGVLQPGTSEGASVNVQLAGGITERTSGGVLRDGLVLGFVAFSGNPEPAPSAVTTRCGGRFSANVTGALEWSITFRVTDETISNDHLCR